MTNGQAREIAVLLNRYNNLRRIYTLYDILNGTYEMECEAGLPVGACEYQCGPYWWIAEVRHLVVSPPYRGRNIAKRLLGRVLRRLYESNVIYAFATIRSTNTPSLSLFEAQGFNRLTVVTARNNVELMVYGRRIEESDGPATLGRTTSSRPSSDVRRTEAWVAGMGVRSLDYPR